MTDELPNENLRQLIRSNGTSVSEIAMDVRIHPSVLSRYIHGKNRPAGKNATVLATYFGVSLEQIRDEEPVTFTDLVAVREV
jgi:transcriptional regulator with XRE-family HTH domain